MRVAFISHLSLNLFRFRGPVIRLLAESGHEPLVFVPDDQHNRELAQLGARVVHYPLVRGSMNPLTLPAPMRALRQLLREHAPHVAHSFTHQPNIITRFAASGLGAARPAMVNSVTGLGSCFLGTGLKGAAVRSLFEALYRRTAPHCDALVFQNSDDRAYFEDRGLAGAALLRMIRGSGVDVQRFRPGLLSGDERARARQEFGFAPQDVVFTLTARLIADKGVREFLEAAQRVRAALPEARFLLVGDPDPGNPASFDREKIARIADRTQVTLAGWREDMERMWSISDVAVLPSYREGLPVSLQEALACGLPVVTTDVPGCREIADNGQSGGHCLLVPAREVEGLAEAMLAFGHDAVRRAKAGRAARAKAEAEFNANVTARAHLELYESLAEINGTDAK